MVVVAPAGEEQQVGEDGEGGGRAGCHRGLEPDVEEQRGSGDARGRVNGRVATLSWELKRFADPVGAAARSL